MGSMIPGVGNVLFAASAASRITATVLGVIAAVGISAIVFIGANRLFDLALRRWSIFSALIGGLSALAIFGLMWGNRLIDQPQTITSISMRKWAHAGQ